jgi:hypothetical protein
MNTIERVQQQDKSIYDATFTIINGMTDGQNKPIDTLTEEVNKTVDMPFNNLRSFVAHFAKAAEADSLCYVSKGKHGGVVKGTRPVKEAKKTKKVRKEQVS